MSSQFRLVGAGHWRAVGYGELRDISGSLCALDKPKPCVCFEGLVPKIVTESAAVTLSGRSKKDCKFEVCSPELTRR